MMINDNSSASPALPPSPAPAVLVVSDSLNMSDKLCNALSSTAYTVLTARNAGEVFWNFKCTMPDCILLDTSSVDFDGFELGRHIKAMPDYSHIPIIFMIGRANEQQIIRSYESGGSDYVGNPPNIPEVLSRLIAQLALANLAKTAPEINPLFCRKIATKQLHPDSTADCAG